MNMNKRSGDHQSGTSSPGEKGHGCAIIQPPIPLPCLRRQVDTSDWVVGGHEGNDTFINITIYVDTKQIRTDRVEVKCSLDHSEVQNYTQNNRLRLSIVQGHDSDAARRCSTPAMMTRSFGDTKQIQAASSSDIFGVSRPYIPAARRDRSLTRCGDARKGFDSFFESTRQVELVLEGYIVASHYSYHRSA